MRPLIFAAALLLSTPAFATEWVHCGDAEDKVSVGLLVGAGWSIVGITMDVGDEAWSSNPSYGSGAPINAAQSYFGSGQIIVTLADDNYENTLAELQIYQAEEGDDYVQGGVIRVPGHGAWVISCEGP